MTDIRWGYALNQWKPQFDDFVRREQHERALKTVSIAGFEGVELTAGTGRWEPLGNPQQLIANFGSLTGFREFLSGCGIAAVSSWFYDPQQRSMEHLTPPYSPLVAADVTGIVTRAEWFAGALAQLGGSVLVVRAASAGDVGPLDDAALRRLADCWTAVGRATLAHGVRTALHVDFLSSLRRPGALDRLLGLADPAAVGLAVDTAELTVAGLDPVEVIRRHPGRVWHVQYKDALAADTDEEYLQPHAEYSVRQRGGSREIPRWFAEPGAHGGLVDFAAVTRALLDIGYAGWVVFESDQSPHPATSALLGGYLLQRELRPMTAAAVEAAAR
ncbi:TIM barrel protein [Microbispora sp. NEAU-D428]|uniref:sugar phosphate isomerase/epimerase family protein n=1 Tax=Microbispora sitophila TaxID=2771537 RepID=UPI0018665CC9|nr:sugar phosphate isomerase/epimerase [Microbispora sitophila]MBE3015985.1 TIM barrel protein [Microbispora sitophila]